MVFSRLARLLTRRTHSKPASRPSLIGGGEFVYPMSANDAPTIGMGFDVLRGEPLSVAAFEPTMLPTGYDVIEINKTDSGFYLIYDESSLQDVMNFEMDTSGGGWGASEGMTVEASARLETTARSVTVHFNGVHRTDKTTVVSGTTLSDAARAILKSGIGKFIETYGTHFVAGYVNGRICKLSYNMKFYSIDAQVSFEGTYKETVTSDVGFDETTDVNLKNTLTASNTTCSFDVEASTSGYNPTISPASFEDLATAKGDFDKATDDTAVAISVVVRPWYFLTEVASTVGLQVGDLQKLGSLVNKWIYISQSCQAFIDDQLYTGCIQLTAVRKVQSRADAALKSLMDVLTEANGKGTSLSVDTSKDGKSLIVQGTPFAFAEPMLSDMQLAMRNFALTFLVSTSNGDVVGSMMNDLNGNPIPAVNEVGSNMVDCRNGAYFNWSLNGQNDWAGTSGTTSNFTDVAWVTIQDTRVKVVLDREKGTLQCWFCIAGEKLSDNYHNDPTPIRGQATDQPVDYTQSPYCIAATFGAVTIKIAPY